MRATPPCEPTQSRGLTMMTNSSGGKTSRGGKETLARASEGLYQPRDSARAFVATITSTTLWETTSAVECSHMSGYPPSRLA
jgi:hypothetical protein